MSIFVILIIACSLLLHFYDVVIHFAYRPTSRSKLNDEQRAYCVSRNHESGQALDFFGG